ncbi:SDR family NAD(P)-dependent oxidoreductase [Alteromonas sp. ASW11-19]|uniref:SDR family NAD(P)-dependent oxidoreductase n=1 Tax=Alteromonas salexigens TaxID=2982530 RepID=A0ABT2VKE0_9ALTE|nr:SDR family NAD(P)-dependent oxidoreductase [Alteromonas salexigens]MCU7553741.1 SDR family NAD(P)-dependent oxidoreductase [Alteromonas salexigens]
MSDIYLVIGAAGGIGRTLVSAWAGQGKQVLAVSRTGARDESWPESVNVMACDSSDGDIAQVVAHIREKAMQVRSAVCTIGFLHGEQNGVKVSPEKQLEALNEAQLNAYFSINTIIPALWIKHLVSVMHPDHATLACLSARVGSISDNRLGGWYGYRASKAALNMLIKTASVEYKRRAKNTSLLCYHPGTVDTVLSEPFQGNVKPEKLFTPEFTVTRLINILETLDPQGSPYYRDWDDKNISW